MSPKLYCALFVTGGLAVWFCSMLALTIHMYMYRVKRTMTDKTRRRLPIHVMLMAIAFFAGKSLNICTTLFDLSNPGLQFPIWIRMPWDSISTLAAIVALHYLFFYERDMSARKL